MLLAALSKMSIEDESPQYNALLALAVARGLKKPKRNKARMSKKRRKAKKVGDGSDAKGLKLARHYRAQKHRVTNKRLTPNPNAWIPLHRFRGALQTPNGLKRAR